MKINNITKLADQFLRIAKSASTEGKYKHINFVPPKSVAKEAEEGLKLRQMAGGKGGLSVSQAKKEGVGEIVASEALDRAEKDLKEFQAREQKKINLKKI